MAEAEYKSEFEHTKDTPYLALTGELWSVFCGDFEENWQRYNTHTLYIYIYIYIHNLVSDFATTLGSCVTMPLRDIFLSSLERKKKTTARYKTCTIFPFKYPLHCSGAAIWSCLQRRWISKCIRVWKHLFRMSIQESCSLFDWYLISMLIH